MSTGAAAFHEWIGSAGEFHGRDLPTPAPGSLDVWAVNPTEATIVAGSTVRVYRFHAGQRTLIDRQGGRRGRVH